MLVLALFFSACGGTPPPTPVPGQQPTDVTDIWYDYENNEARANETWKGRWLHLRMNSVDKIESGKVRKNMGSFGWSHIEFQFKDDSAVLDIDKWDSVVATCWLSGWKIDSWLVFRSCVRHQPLLPTLIPVPTAISSIPRAALMDYGEWCVSERDSLPRGNEIKTWGEATEIAEQRRLNYESVDPPEELRNYHVATILVFKAVHIYASNQDPQAEYVRQEMFTNEDMMDIFAQYDEIKEQLPIRAARALAANGCF